MSERDGYRPGEPCWVDHSSLDPAGAAEFYGGLFGWETEDRMPAEMDGSYFMAELGGKAVAALGTQQNPDAPATWNTYVSVENADETAAKVSEAGGTAYGEPFDVFGAGRMGIVADAAGAMFCLWQPDDHRGAQLVNEPGAFSWSELTTRDPEGSKAFYGSVFGWQGTGMDFGGVDYTVWHLEGTDPGAEDPIGGMMPMVGEGWPDELPSHWMVYFTVDDTNATAVNCQALGGAVSVEPFDTPQGKVAVLTDPQGAFFSVIEMTVATP